MRPSGLRENGESLPLAKTTCSFNGSGLCFSARLAVGLKGIHRFAGFNTRELFLRPKNRLNQL
jgi:hypothetical protein